MIESRSSEAYLHKDVSYVKFLSMIYSDTTAITSKI